MPWCEDCAKFYNPNTLDDQGACPTCGAELKLATKAEPDDSAAQAAKIPWHFWVLLAALALYLGWRLIQGVDALFGLLG